MHTEFESSATRIDANTVRLTVIGKGEQHATFVCNVTIPVTVLTTSMARAYISEAVLQAGLDEAMPESALEEALRHVAEAAHAP